MIPAQVTMTPTPKSATQSEISSLSKNVHALGHRVNLANNLYIWFLAATLVASVLIVRFNGKLSAAKDALQKVKDDAVTRDLAAKGETIAELDKARADAEKETATLKHDMMIRDAPRWSRIIPALGESVQKAPPGSVEVIFAPENDEAHRTALAIEAELSAAGKWKIVKSASPASRDRTELILPLFVNDPFNTPLMSKMGLLSDITVIVSPEDLSDRFPRKGTAVHALLTGLHKCEFQSIFNIDARLASGSARVLVGAKE